MTKARILVVDDDEQVLEVVSAMLESDGHDVVGVADGEAAVVAATMGRFDVVFLDVRMPGPGGVETLRMLRERMPEAHYVMMSGAREADVEDECTRDGAAAFLQKPLRLEALSSLVQRLTQ